ncbi:MAG: DUF3800 domain-containing protein [Rickettsiales bacterium]|nr:DUF3800 domain-containing protein [Rickettsiales bacterium]
MIIEQAHNYFKQTAIGKQRASLIIPEPFFVHSELTTGIQIADLIAYIISWGFRTTHINKPARKELADFASQVANLRYKATREKNGESYSIWSFAHITDLRTRAEKEFFE